MCSLHSAFIATANLPDLRTVRSYHGPGLPFKTTREAATARNFTTSKTQESGIGSFVRDAPEHPQMLALWRSKNVSRGKPEVPIHFRYTNRAA